jgi:hypothetical protein
MGYTLRLLVSETLSDDAFSTASNFGRWMESYARRRFVSDESWDLVAEPGTEALLGHSVTLMGPDAELEEGLWRGGKQWGKTGSVARALFALRICRTEDLLERLPLAVLLGRSKDPVQLPALEGIPESDAAESPEALQACLEPRFAGIPLDRPLEGHDGTLLERIQLLALSLTDRTDPAMGEALLGILENLSNRFGEIAPGTLRIAPELTTARVLGRILDNRRKRLEEEEVPALRVILARSMVRDGLFIRSALEDPGRTFLAEALSAAAKDPWGGATAEAGFSAALAASGFPWPFPEARCRLAATRALARDTGLAGEPEPLL